MDIKIKKAKLTKSSTIEATYIDEDGNEITIKGKNTVHVDLKTRLAALIPYFADLTEQKEADRYDWVNPDSQENIDLMRRLDVTGVSLGGDDNCPIATLTGRRTLMSSKVLNINTPPTDLDSDDSGWIRAEDFRFAIDAFFYEVHQYITEKKWAVKQGEFVFENSDDPFANAGITADVESITEIKDSVETTPGQVA
jgi:hypothetical protein